MKHHLSENKIAVLKGTLRLVCALRKGIPVKNIKHQLKLKHTLVYTVPLTELGCKFVAKVQFVIFIVTEILYICPWLFLWFFFHLVTYTIYRKKSQTIHEVFIVINMLFYSAKSMHLLIESEEPQLVMTKETYHSPLAFWWCCSNWQQGAKHTISLVKGTWPSITSEEKWMFPFRPNQHFIWSFPEKAPFYMFFFPPH